MYQIANDFLRNFCLISILGLLIIDHIQVIESNDEDEDGGMNNDKA